MKNLFIESSEAHDFHFLIHLKRWPKYFSIRVLFENFIDESKLRSIYSADIPYKYTSILRQYQFVFIQITLNIPNNSSDKHCVIHRTACQTESALLAEQRQQKILYFSTFVYLHISYAKNAVACNFEIVLDNESLKCNLSAI